MTMLRFLRDDTGQDLIEYGLLAAVISVSAIAAVTGLAGVVRDAWTDINARIPNSAAS